MREQKLLVKLHDLAVRKQLALVYRKAAGRLEDDIECRRATNYADFVALFAEAAAEFAATSNSLLPVFEQLSLTDLLEVSESVLDPILEEQVLEFRRQMKAVNSNNSVTPEVADASEFELQYVQARSKDCIFAFVRAFNAASARIRSDNRRCGNRSWLRNAKDTFTALFVTANRWNSLDYAFDKVTYGDWFVADIQHSDIPMIRFGDVDLQLTKASLLGMRRWLVHSMLVKKKHDRFARNLIVNESMRAIPAAAEYYRSKFRSPDLDASDYKNFQQTLQSGTGDSDDDLLIASDPSFIPHYHAGCLLRTYRDVATTLLRHLSKKDRQRLPRPSLPITEIACNAARKGVDKEELEAALKSHVLDLPVRNHMDLLDRPFINGPNGKVYAIADIGMTWLESLRQRLVGGGSQIKKFGAIWEDFIGATLEDYGWVIVGRGVILRRDGQTVTDIDILAFRDGLLLVIQVKAFAQSGANVYSQWKAKCGIEKGVDQAKLSTSFLHEHPEFTRGLLSQGKCKAPAEQIQPLVLTNAPYFGGWQCRGIPVVGLSDLMSVLKGARVEYGHQKGVLEEVSLCKGEVSTNEEFLKFLSNPVSFQIAAEIDEVEYISAGPGPIDLQLPMHTRNDGRSWAIDRTTDATVESECDYIDVSAR